MSTTVFTGFAQQELRGMSQRYTVCLYGVGVLYFQQQPAAAVKRLEYEYFCLMSGVSSGAHVGVESDTGDESGGLTTGAVSKEIGVDDD